MNDSDQRRPFDAFWAWYERHYVINVALAAGLFVLQLVHLYWLTTDVVFARLFGESFFSPSLFWKYLIIIVDYAEIPAIVSTSILYTHELRRAARKQLWRPLLFLFLINSQWLHLFWITDEFVIQQFAGEGEGTILPLWLAWIAILIDYLELPVIIDTLRKLYRALCEGSILQAAKETFKR